MIPKDVVDPKREDLCPRALLIFIMNIAVVKRHWPHEAGNEVS